MLTRPWILAVSRLLILIAAAVAAGLAFGGVQLWLLAVLALPVIFAVTLHEAAHGWMAGRLGDATARMLGRVTLNPIRHIDPVGTLLVPMATILLTTQVMGSFFLFG